MRRLCAANWTIALGVALSGAASLLADGPPGPMRPQPRIIVYQSPTNAPAAIAVMGQVSQPGTYQFPGAPTLADAMQAAKGLKQTASPMVRIVRGQRVAQRISLATGANEKLLPGDLVIVDAQATRDRAPQAGAAVPPVGIQLALIGVVDRPVVVLVKPSEANPETISLKLGQSPMKTAIHVLPPPNAVRDPSGRLPDGCVLLFDPRRIDRAELPDDLPKVIPCGLPEPDIGGYGVYHAIEQRNAEPTPEMVREGAIPWSNSPLPDDLTQVPLPMNDANASPTLIPDDRLPARFSTSLDDRSPISRVPFATRNQTTALPMRLTESIPAEANAAPDAREPAWNKVASATIAPVLEADAELAPPEPRGFSMLQRVSILTSIVLLGGLALVLRFRQANSEPRQSSTRRATQASLAGSMANPAHMGTIKTIPAPHIPLESFAAGSAIQAGSRAAAAKHETREMQELAFRGILKNDLPLVVEPLALRPGLKISLPHDEGAIRRLDESDIGLPAPHRSTMPAPHIAAAQASQASERHIIDHPHLGRAPSPHVRTGNEAPVERALRQLQGGAR